MANLSLQQAAAKYGVPYALLKKHAQRGKIEITKDGSRTSVTDEAMEAYRDAEKLGTAVDTMSRAADHSGYRDLGNVIANLGSKAQEAILAGMPLAGRAPGPRSGNSDAFKALPTRGDIDEHPLVKHADDIHFMFPVGFAHSSSPRWERVDESTWKLGDATYTFTGFGWEGGGSKAGVILGDGITPAHPDAGRRPLGPNTEEKKRGRAAAGSAARDAE